MKHFVGAELTFGPLLCLPIPLVDHPGTYLLPDPCEELFAVFDNGHVVAFVFDPAFPDRFVLKHYPVGQVACYARFPTKKGSVE